MPTRSVCLVTLSYEQGPGRSGCQQSSAEFYHTIHTIPLTKTRCVCVYVFWSSCRHTSGAAGMYDIKTGACAVTFDVGDDAASINCMRSHHTMPIVAMADERNQITFYDLKSGNGNTH